MVSANLLDAKEAAKYLRMSVAWLYASDVPFAKLGSARRYRKEDLDAFVAKRLRR